MVYGIGKRVLSPQGFLAFSIPRMVDPGTLISYRLISPRGIAMPKGNLALKPLCFGAILRFGTDFEVRPNISLQRNMI